MLAIDAHSWVDPKFCCWTSPPWFGAATEELFEKIVAINKKGTPILMVEQNASMALEISDYAYVINQGSIEISGAAKDVACDDRVINAYLGVHAGQC